MRRWRWVISISRKNAWRASRSFVNAAAPSCFARTARTTSAACATAPCGWPQAACVLWARPSRCWGPTRCIHPCAPPPRPPPPAAPVGTSAPQGLSAAPDDGGARILSLTLADLGPGEPALLEHADLVATIVVRGPGDEQPNIGFMIEQSRGSGITSLATHEEGAAPVRQPDGSWRSVLTFPALPLHSGEYVVSAFLFDASGLVVYDQWLQHLHFRFVSPTLMPGLVRLPHRWS